MTLLVLDKLGPKVFVGVRKTDKPNYILLFLLWRYLTNGNNEYT